MRNDGGDLYVRRRRSEPRFLTTGQQAAGSLEPMQHAGSYLVSACLFAVAHISLGVGISPQVAEAGETTAQNPAENQAKFFRQLYECVREAWPQPQVDPGIQWQEIGPLPDVQHPEDNPFSPAKEELGKTLFFDPRLSGSRQIACASCHDPDLAWADGRTVSFGHHREPLKRNAPTIRNIAFQQSLFWDGRADTVEQQVEQVLLNPAEMHITRQQLVAAVAAVPGYREQFAVVFGSPGVSFERTVQAVACFQRTVVGGGSRFDRFVRGEYGLLSDAEVRGLDLFRRRARCLNCHHGPLFSDGQFHDVGLSYYGRRTEDLGRYRVTGKPDDVGRFRTPSLRDVTKTEPLMHNGLFKLSGVLNMYNAGMPTLKRQAYQQSDPLFPTKSPHLKPLGLSRQELADLAAFLATLEEPYRRIRPPALAVPAVP